MKEVYCYVAVDPEHADAAWSVCVDRDAGDL